MHKPRKTIIARDALSSPSAASNRQPRNEIGTVDFAVINYLCY